VTQSVQERTSDPCTGFEKSRSLLAIGLRHDFDTIRIQCYEVSGLHLVGSTQRLESNQARLPMPWQYFSTSMPQHFEFKRIFKHLRKYTKSSNGYDDLLSPLYSTSSAHDDVSLVNVATDVLFIFLYSVTWRSLSKYSILISVFYFLCYISHAIMEVASSSLMRDSPTTEFDDPASCELQVSLGRCSTW
jgi:hypothetical protein